MASCRASHRKGRGCGHPRPVGDREDAGKCSELRCYEPCPVASDIVCQELPGKKRLEKSFGLNFNLSLGNFVYTSDQSNTVYLVTKTSKVLFEGSGASSQQSGFQDHGTGIRLAIAVNSQTREQYMDQIIAIISKYDTGVFGFFGALVGGLITFGIQAYALRVRRKQREEDLRRTQQILGHSLLIKIFKINSNFQKLHKQLEECVTNSTVIEKWAQHWEIFKPLASLPNPVYYSSEEMSMLMSIDKDQVFNLIFPLDTDHNTLLATIAKLQEEQARFHDRIEIDPISGSFYAVIPTSTEYPNIEDTFNYMVNELNRLYKESERCLSDLKKALCALRRLLGEKLGIRIDLEEE